MSERIHYLLLFFITCLLSLATVSAVMAADKDRFRHEDDEIMMRLVLRSSEQLNAFYLGRQFPQQAIDRILDTCLVSAIVHNRSFDVLWLELDNWEFTVDGEEVERIDRDYWQQQWDQAGLKQAHQSTFGWTLLPEVRDLRRDEGAGGGVVISNQSRPFTLTAKFRTGKNKKGKLKVVQFEGVPCPGNM